MTNPSPNNIDSSWIDEVLDKFGNDYEMPYRLMHDNEKTPMEQLPLARKQLIDEAKAEIQKKLTEARINSPTYQIAIRQQKTKMGLWSLCIAQYGKAVFGDIYRTEQEAYDALPTTLKALQNRNDDDPHSS